MISLSKMATPTVQASGIRTTDEVVFVSTSGSEDQTWNVGAWDVRTGNLLQTFRNGSAAPGSLCMLGGECLLAASSAKPMIHMWNMLRQSQKHRKIIIGSKISCMACCPRNKFLAAGIEDKIHIWQVCNGVLHSILSYGSVEVKCLKFTSSGQHLVSGYKDGTFAAWELQDVLFTDPMSILDHRPVSTFVGHTGEMTDFHISVSNRVVSSGTDYSVRVWDLLSKEELKVFELGDVLMTSVLIDNAELTLYAGDVTGNVYCIDLNYMPDQRTVFIDSREQNPGFIVFPAHLGAVRHLCLTRDQSRLVSAGDDKTVKIWSMMSPVAPIKIDFTDVVSNLMVVSTPLAFIFPDARPTVQIGNLSRHLQGGEGEENSDDIFVEMKCTQQIPKKFGLRKLEEKMDGSEQLSKGEEKPEAVVNSKELTTLKQKATKLRKANEEIYQFAIKAIVK